MLTKILSNRFIVIRVLLSILLLVLISFLIWASFRGFDFSDESYYHIGFWKDNLEPPYTVIFFHRIYNTLFGLFGFTFVQNRILGIFLLLFSSMLLGYSIALYFKLKDTVTAILFPAIFSFLGYVIFPMGTSYNLFSIVFITLTTALSFLSFRKNNLYYAPIIGFLTVLIVLNKFTNLLYLFYFFAGLGVLDNYKKEKNILFYIKFKAFAIIGVCIGLLVVFDSVEELIQKFEGFKQGLSFSTDHNLLDMVQKFGEDFWEQIQYLLYLIPFVVFIFYIKKKQPLKLITFSMIYLGFMFVLFFLFHFFLSKSYIFSFYFISLGVILFVLYYEENLPSAKILALVFFMLGIPFVGSAGTNNSLFIQSLLYGSFIGAGLIILIDKIKNNIVKSLMILVISLTATLQIIYNKLYHSYRVGNLLEQTEEITGSHYLQNLFVDIKTKKMVDTLQVYKNHPSEAIFVTAPQLGVCLIVEKPPILLDWIDESNYHFISPKLTLVYGVKDKNILFFLPHTKEQPKIIEQLTKIKALNFEKDYHHTSRIELKNRATTQQIDVFEKVKNESK